MRVFSYYYGAHPSKGIGVRAQSRELANNPVGAVLKELASLHALGSSDHSGEMLSYFLVRNNYRILGASYPEQPKDSGYNRIAPCGLQYIFSNDDVSTLLPKLGKVFNFVSFQKPKSEVPEAMSSIPVNDSGYSFHNKPSVLATLIEAFLQVAFAPDQETLLVALPKGKSNEYATARYTIAEVLDHLPTSLRGNIRFFTGLPVAEDVSDPVRGYDTAIRYHANVIFCPAEYYERLRTHRSCLSVNMEQPDQAVGNFARYVSSVPDTSAALVRIDNNMTASYSYNALNNAVQRIQNGNLVTTEVLQQELTASRRLCAEMEQKVLQADKELQKSKETCAQYAAENQRLYTQIQNMPQYSHSQNTRQTSDTDTHNSKDKKNKKKFLILLILHIVVAALLAGAFILLTSGKEQNVSPAVSVSSQSQIEQQADTPEQSAVETGSLPEKTNEPDISAGQTAAPSSGCEVIKQINRNGTVNNNVSNPRFRSSPTNKDNSNIICTIPNGSELYVYEEVTDQDKKLWYRVKYNDKEGYIIASVVTLAEIEASPTPSPSPSPSPIPTTPVPTPGPTAVPTPGPTAVPTPGPTAVPTPGPTLNPGNTEYPSNATVNNTSSSFTNFRETPSQSNNDNVIAKIPNNGDNRIYISSKDTVPSKPEDGNTWYQANYKGKDGYILCADDYIKITFDDETGAE